MITFLPNPDCAYDLDYEAIIAHLNEAILSDNATTVQDTIRQYSTESLFFLMHFVLRVGEVNTPWLVERIKEVQGGTDGYMDLWAREHWKSSIKTWANNIRKILLNPERRIGIFSHTRGLAKDFLRRIKLTLENNNTLKLNFPDILWQNPKNDAPKWSEDDGLLVRRSGIYNEMTVEAWGLVDNMPTGKHFTDLDYDDVVTRDSVNTPEQIKKVEECFRLSLNLGVRTAAGGEKTITGTHYHFADLYSVLRKQGTWNVRVYPAENAEGEPVYLTSKELKAKRIEFGPYVYSCQMLLNPVADDLQTFDPNWLRFYRKLPDTKLAIYITCDPASGRKEKDTGHDWTVFWVWGIDFLGNYYCLDMVRERLNLAARWRTLKGLVRQFRTVQQIGYEQYGMMADIEHFKEMALTEGAYFTGMIKEVSGRMNKRDRIRRLIPLFEAGKVYLPEFLNRDGRDLVKEFIDEEYRTFPYSVHDDMLDAASRIRDMDAYAPTAFPDDYDEDRQVVESGWIRRKRESRYANV